MDLSRSAGARIRHFDLPQSSKDFFVAALGVVGNTNILSRWVNFWVELFVNRRLPDPRPLTVKSRPKMR